MHIFAPPDAAVNTLPQSSCGVGNYQMLQTQLKTQRAVVVQPRFYGFDNTVTLAAIQSLGLANTRGIAVLPPDVSITELLSLHTQGIRGVRFTLYTPKNAVVNFDMLEPIAHKIHAVHGQAWHLQLHWTADQIVAHADLLLRLPIPIVFDHLGRMPVSDFKSHAAFGIINNLMQAERAWLKLSGAYLCSRQGLPYADTGDLARSWLSAAPHRLVWGSDWPHITEVHKPKAQQPNAGELLTLFHDWTGSDTLSHTILVDNPVSLYGF